MINWQPIATAPLDGTDVLVYDGYDVWKACYEVESVLWLESCQKVVSSLFHEPTHWLPISDLLQPLGYTP